MFLVGMKDVDADIWLRVSCGFRPWKNKKNICCQMFYEQHVRCKHTLILRQLWERHEKSVRIRGNNLCAFPPTAKYNGNRPSPSPDTHSSLAHRYTYTIYGAQRHSLIRSEGPNRWTSTKWWIYKALLERVILPRQSSPEG